MLETLVGDLRDLEHRGAGYYSVVPYAERYNKLLGQIKAIYPENAALLATFAEVTPTASSDPAVKLKSVEQLIVEINQLLAFIEASSHEGQQQGEPR